MNKFNFWKKFSHFLLIGFSALVLFAGVQSGMVGDFKQRGPDQVLADNEEECGTGPDQPGCPNPGGSLGEVPFIPPTAPAAPVTTTPTTSGPSCTANFQYNQCVACNESEPVYTNSCSGAFSTGPRQADAACASWCSAPGPQCTPNEVVRQETHCVGQQSCTYNVHHRADCSEYHGGDYGCQNSTACGFNNPPSCSAGVIATNKTCVGNSQCSIDTSQRSDCSKFDGAVYGCQNVVGQCGFNNPPPDVCNPTTSPENACVGQQYCSYSVTRDCRGNIISRNQTGCQNVVGQCGFTSTCIPNNTCSAPTPSCGQTTTGVDNCNNRCSRTGAACVTPPPPPPPAAPITITTGSNTNSNPTTVTNNITNSNPTTVTVTNPAPQGAAPATVTREVVRQVQTFGNVGVATSTTQIAAVKQLPNTGLPALAWAAAAFVPAGFKIRRFSKVKEETAAKPHFLWEDRQFKV